MYPENNECGRKYSVIEFNQFSENMDREFQTSPMIKNEKNDLNSTYLVSFSQNSENCCVGMVDMVNSTKISARLGSRKTSRYYQVFINSMSRIIRQFRGRVIKNIGDCVLYYFPYDIENPKSCLFASLDCGLEMIELHKTLCQQLADEKLPCLDYRISVDFGSVTIMKSNNSLAIDMIGSPVNICSKINRLAPKNGLVIGGDLHELIKKFSKYNFKEKQGYSIGLKHQYPVFELIRK